MKDIAYYNGKIGRIDEVQAPITDRGFYFGDGVYDAAMVNNKKIFELEDHLDRFYNSLKLLRIEPPMQRDELSVGFGCAAYAVLAVHACSGTPHARVPQGRQGQPDGIFRAVRTGPPGSSVQADFGRGHAFSALQHQNAQPYSELHGNAAGC